jgi:hypothetical protein
MPEPISIDPGDRVQQRVMERDESAATEELIHCTTALDDSLASLARAFPGSTGFGAIDRGRACGIFVFTRSAQGELCLKIARDKMLEWAQLIAHLSPDLRNYFEAEYRVARLQADGGEEEKG